MHTVASSSILIRVCSLIVTCNIFVGCPKSIDNSTEGATKKINLGTYNLVPQDSAAEFKILAAEYRIISFQESGYWVSTDTGLTYVVDSMGKISKVDKSDIELDEYSKVFSTASGEIWRITKNRVYHSKTQQHREVPGEMRVLWFGEYTLLAYGDYDRGGNGGIGRGFQVVTLNPNGTVKILAGPLPDIEVEDADQFISGGMSDQEQHFWLWTRNAGLRVASLQAKMSIHGVISFPKIDKQVKDLGFNLTVSDDKILPPSYVLAIAAGEGNTGSIYTARSSP